VVACAGSASVRRRKNRSLTPRCRRFRGARILAAIFADARVKTGCVSGFFTGVASWRHSAGRFELARYLLGSGLTTTNPVPPAGLHAIRRPIVGWWRSPAGRGAAAPAVLRGDAVITASDVAYTEFGDAIAIDGLWGVITAAFDDFFAYQA